MSYLDRLAAEYAERHPLDGYFVRCVDVAGVRYLAVGTALVLAPDYGYIEIRAECHHASPRISDLAEQPVELRWRCVHSVGDYATASRVFHVYLLHHVEGRAVRFSLIVPGPDDQRRVVHEKSRTIRMTAEGFEDI